MAPFTFKTDSFDCTLQCTQCIYRKEDGEQCRNRVCMSAPYCWTHTKKKYGVKVVKNKTFEGLIATRNHEAGSFIIPFHGELITSACIDNRYGNEDVPPYAVASADGLQENWMDAACWRGAAAAAKNRMEDANAEWIYDDEVEHDGETWLVATRDIRRSEEIIVRDVPSGIRHKTGRSKKEDTRPC